MRNGYRQPSKICERSIDHDHGVHHGNPDGDLLFDCRYGDPSGSNNGFELLRFLKLTWVIYPLPLENIG